MSKEYCSTTNPDIVQDNLHISRDSNQEKKWLLRNKKVTGTGHVCPHIKKMPHISLALFDFPFCRDWTRGESAVPTGRSMIAVMQNPQLPLTRNYNFIHLHIDKIINPPE